MTNEEARTEGAKLERAKVVSYLREQEAEEYLACCIEEGEHDGAPVIRNGIVIVSCPGDACSNTKKLPDGSRCPGCRACS